MYLSLVLYECSWAAYCTTYIAVEAYSTNLYELRYMQYSTQLKYTCTAINAGYIGSPTSHELHVLKYGT